MKKKMIHGQIGLSNTFGIYIHIPNIEETKKNGILSRLKFPFTMKSMIELELENSPFKKGDFVSVIMEESDYNSKNKVQSGSVPKVIIMVEVDEAWKGLLHLKKPIKKKRTVFNILKRILWYSQLGSISLETPFERHDVIKIIIEKELNKDEKSKK